MTIRAKAGGIRRTIVEEPLKKYPCACKTPDDLDGCMEMVDEPNTLCEFCEECRQP